MTIPRIILAEAVNAAPTITALCMAVVWATSFGRLISAFLCQVHCRARFSYTTSLLLSIRSQKLHLSFLVLA